MNSSNDAALSVNVTEEQLDIRRETVDTGRPPRLRKQVETVPTVVREPLDVETVHVERVPLGRVVVVDAQDERQADEATSCLQSLGALDIDEQASQWRAEGWKGSPQAADSSRSDQRLRDDAPPVGKEGVMDVAPEELHVGKRNVD